MGGRAIRSLCATPLPIEAPDMTLKSVGKFADRCAGAVKNNIRQIDPETALHLPKDQRLSNSSKNTG